MREAERGASVGVDDGTSMNDGVTVGSGEGVDVGCKVSVRVETVEGIEFSIVGGVAVWHAAKKIISKEAKKANALIIFMMN